MKLKRAYRDVVNSKGITEKIGYPGTREEAYAEDMALYFPVDFKCEIHNERSVHYTATGISKCCANRDAVAAYNEALAAGEPVSIGDARAQGKNYYWFPMPGAYCGHPGKFTLAGKCMICSESHANSPRQIAIASGAAWYMPGEFDPCAKGHIAERRVANGSCKQCELESRAAAKAAKAVSPPADQLIHRLCPDMEISREDAIGLGFKVYRTGKECSKGHKGWRYVSTCSCLTCMGRD